MHVKGASMAAAKWSYMIPQHSTQARCFLLFLEREGNRAPGEKPLKVRLRSTETHCTYDHRGWTRKCRTQRQPDFPRHAAQGINQDGYRPDINPAQQDFCWAFSGFQINNRTIFYQ